MKLYKRIFPGWIVSKDVSEQEISKYLLNNWYVSEDEAKGIYSETISNIASSIYDSINEDKDK